MNTNLIRDVIIVGGGTSGWMTAAALARTLQGQYNIRLVESDEIGIVGVGEATIPMIQRFNHVLGIDENDFLRETQGTFKLGIEFVNWGKLGDRYMHGFGTIGQDTYTVRFDQYWQKYNQQGKVAKLEEYSITRMAAKANKFMPANREVENSPLNQIAHAYHFDASLYAKYLRKYAEKLGVIRTEGKITRVVQRDTDGFVTGLVLEDGTTIDGDLFIDCSGFRGLLIEQTLHTGYEDWTHYLPCDRAIAVPCESAPTLLPYTRSTAHKAGWQWRIPLQHRIGNGHVFCSQFISEDEATACLLANLDGKPLADPRLIKFTTGMRKQAWNKNVVAIGLAGGFLEPLESTSIHLIQTAIARLIQFFPSREFSQIDIKEYNRQSRFEFERIRDFVILHYKLNQRDDADFWKNCAAMAVPDSLTHKMEMYRASGRLLRVDDELFAEVGWLQVFEGQNMPVEGYHALVDLQTEVDTLEYLESVRDVIKKCVNVMPDHAAYIAKHCAAPRS
ncbi:tryptophan halogenase family protein [Undibacterium fentianense]|uniref:Tryptophan 7-halogenase n=1 Tax=Undibacterium fentianense TaxID=2828728 RepID=A0A941E5Q7_9BURK|nr:tryptophan halogenase family protein [Undibacterium fentianense]MBR7801104.1 tryptophan 7-halogenase [Undibacterium fentianense]